MEYPTLKKKKSFRRVLVIACYDYRGSKSQFYAPGEKQEKKTVIIDELYKSIFFCDFVVVEIRMH